MFTKAKMKQGLIKIPLSCKTITIISLVAFDETVDDLPGFKRTVIVYDFSKETLTDCTLLLHENERL